MVAVAFAAFAVLAYTYFGYPVVIAVLARLRPKSSKPDPSWTPMVSVIMAVHNAAEYIQPKLKSLTEQDYPADRLEILVCSDASDDRSDKLLAEMAAQDPRIRPFRLESRSGKPSAINHVLPQVRGDVLLMTDIRQPLSANCVRDLTSQLADPAIGAVSGNLVLQGKTGGGAYWRYEKWIRQNEGRFRSLVGVSGSIYALRTEHMAPLPSEIILDDMWVPMRLRLQSLRIGFAPEAVAVDTAFEDDREFARKVRTLAGNYQLLARMPALLVPLINPSWFETFSHKILRLVCPWALLVLLAATTASLCCPAHELTDSTLWMMRGLLAGQALFYLLAALGPVARSPGRLARTFVVLNWAAVVGLWRFVTGGQRITW